MEGCCSSVLDSMQQVGVNFIAIDFDLTLVEDHTHGRWMGTVEELAEKVRPFFLSLIPLALSRGFCVAIVTFSPQTHMVAAVLKIKFPHFYNRIPIRGEDRSWIYDGKGSREGKQAHMASAAEEVSRVNNIDVTRNSTILIDDDANNCRIAIDNQVKAVHFDPANIDKTMERLKTLHK